MSSSTATRSRYEADVEAAYRIQAKAGILGMLRGTTIGLSLAVIAHYSWPVFRRQTLPFKAFLVSAFTMSGLVIEAESALMKYQTIKRREENAARREAKIALAKQGLVGTESEIAAWRDNQEALARSQRSEQSQ
ncbi:hypothetical protein BDV98DRAFT_569218 [Pterulicium gracile]|uniref:HIG1 domain-containing protein n=1 Tax=Pterulicium gracile TaxID=1884261 RepID=A0A5C3QER6_9AGAR|nr:hypothetical protein BDV98DRAFT_569218 [Pterula gracilis]